MDRMLRNDEKMLNTSQYQTQELLTQKPIHKPLEQMAEEQKTTLNNLRVNEVKQKI